MYYFLLLLLLLVLCSTLIFHRRKRKIIQKICCMSSLEKCETLNRLIEPFGYCYDRKQDIFSTCENAWQRNFGYTENYNLYAPHFNMVFDNEPFYFDYKNKTWLIQLWKGQYGINTGGEIGVYYSDSFVPPMLRDITMFHCVKEKDMLPMCLHLYKRDTSLARLCHPHWWLTTFLVGMYSEPESLSMHVSITFPNEEMRDAFVNALQLKGYDKKSICICRLTVSFLYDSCSVCQTRRLRRLYFRYIQWKNRTFVKLYLKVTRPFCCSLDRVLFLYYFLPFAFRRMFTIRRYKAPRRS